MRRARKKLLLMLTLAVTLILMSATMALGAEYYLESTPDTVHWGYWWAKEAPVLTINSGDTVTIDTLSHEGILPDQGPPIPFFGSFGIPADQVLPDLVQVYAQEPQGAGNHVLTGPIYVNGAEPGDVLEVRVLEVKPRVPYGVNAIRTGKGALPEIFTINTFKLIPLDLQRNLAVFSDGKNGKPRIEIPINPYMGCMGVAPAPHLGKASSIPPDAFGGNIDLNEMKAGSSLYLPVHVQGALFSTGDGHAVMGDGEVSLTAVEASLTGKFQFILHKDRKLYWPMAEDADYYIILAFHEDLDTAMKMAVKQTVDFLVTEKGLTPEEAYALASVAVDFEVTQVVDKNKGIHGLIPKSIFK